MYSLGRCGPTQYEPVFSLLFSCVPDTRCQVIIIIIQYASFDIYG